MCDSDSKNSSFLFGIILGAIIGAIIAIVIYKNNKGKVLSDLEKKVKSFLSKTFPSTVTKSSPPKKPVIIPKKRVILPAKRTFSKK